MRRTVKIEVLGPVRETEMDQAAAASESIVGLTEDSFDTGAFDRVVDALAIRELLDRLDHVGRLASVDDRCSPKLAVSCVRASLWP